MFNLDAEKLAAIGQRIGPSLEQVLTAPIEDLFPRGDVHKPFAGAVASAHFATGGRGPRRRDSRISKSAWEP